MTVLSLGQLNLGRCPHCNVDKPMLVNIHQAQTQDYTGYVTRGWTFHKCNRCGGVVTAGVRTNNCLSEEIYPSAMDVDQAIPEVPREYLNQAVNSLSSPSGAVMLAASAVDAMLKSKELKKGSLYARIDTAAKEHLITNEMALWAHKVRLDANDQRHADEEASLPSVDDAKRSVDFALALAQFMFVLPAMVQIGIEETKVD